MPEDLLTRLRQHLARPSERATQLFCIHWLEQDYFVGWYTPGATSVWATRITYPASSPFGWITAGSSKRFTLNTVQPTGSNVENQN